MTAKSVRVLVTSGRTLGQGRAIEKGKTSQEYVDAVAVCELGTTAFEALGIEEGDVVVVRSENGKTVVKSKLNEDVQAGTAFMPCGPYFNALVGSYTQQTGLPEFKAVEATVSPAPNSKVLSIDEMARTSKRVTK